MIFEITYIKHSKRMMIVREAENIDQLQLDDLGVVLKIRPKKEKIKFFKKRVGVKNLRLAFLQLSLLLDSSIGINQAILEIANTSSDKQIKKIFLSVYNDLMAGVSLGVSFDKFRMEMGSNAIAFIKLGESSGRLTDSINRMCEALKSQSELNERIKRASVYPAVVFCSVFVAFFVLCTFVVPQFADIFSQMGVQLPLVTRIILGIYDFLNNYFLFLLIFILICLLVFVRFYSRNLEFKLFISKAILKIYPFGIVIKSSNLSMFCLLLSELVSSGMPIVSALNQASSSVPNLYLSTRLRTISDRILAGVALQNAFKQTEVFDQTAMWLLSSMEKTGKLSKSLDDTRYYYFYKFDDISKNIQTFFEPILLIFVGLLVFVLALGVLLPIWDMTSTLNF